MASDSMKSQRLEDFIGNAELLSSVFSSIQDGISILDKNLNIIAVNPAMEKWYAHAMPLVGKKCHAAYHGRDKACEVCPSCKTLRTEKTARDTVPMVGPGKQVVGWIDLYSFPLLDPATGALRGVIEYVRDITDQKKAEEASRENELRFRLLFDNAPLAIFQSRPDGEVIDVNAAFIRTFGYPSRESFLERVKNAEVLFADPEQRREIVRELNTGSAPSVFENVYKKMDGFTFVGLLRLNTVRDGQGNLNYLEGFIEDITERKRNEASLRESEERYRKVVEQSWQGILVALGSPFRFAFANSRAAEILGHSVEALLGLSPDAILHLIHPDDLSTALQRFDDIFFKDKTLPPRIFRFVRKDGSHCWVELFGRAVVFQGEPAIQIAMLDVTEKKKAEDALKRELELNTALSRLYAPLVRPSSTIAEIAKAVLDQAKTVTHSLYGYVSEIDPETRANVAHTLTEMLKGQCLTVGPDQRNFFPIGSDGRYPGLWGYTLNTKQAFFTNEPASHPSSRGIPKGHIPLKNFLSMPVLMGKILVGQIALANSERDYSEKDVQAVQRMSEFYTLAIQRRRTQQALEESEANLSALAQNANDAILIAVDERSHEYANRRAAALTGYSAQELLKTGSEKLIRFKQQKKDALNPEKQP
ncbi:MAG TPA: PAS domain S-box protein, partial [bacterium]